MITLDRSSLTIHWQPVNRDYALCFHALSSSAASANQSSESHMSSLWFQPFKIPLPATSTTLPDNGLHFIGVAIIHWQGFLSGVHSISTSRLSALQLIQVEDRVKPRKGLG